MAQSGGHECIYIYYIPSDGGMWADFLHEKLNEKDYMLSSCLVDISKLEDDHLVHDVNIILVSPEFLNLKSLQPLMVLHQIRSLVVLLGVDKHEYDVFVRDCRSNLCDWDVFETESTEKSVRQLLLRIINLYETSHPDEVHKHSAHIYYDSNEEEDYSHLPKQRPKSVNTIISPVRESRISQSSLVTKSEYDVPSSMTESVYDVPPSASEDFYDVPTAIYPKSAKPHSSSNASYQSVTDDENTYRVLQHYTGGVQEVYVILNRKSKDEVVLVSEDGRIEKFTPLNKTLYKTELKEPGKQFTIKDGNKDLGNYDIKSFKTTHERSKSEMIKDLLLDETHPISLLCTSLGISGKTSNSLDRYLEAKCKLPNIAKSLYETFKCTDPETVSKDVSDEDCPTLLHFCSEYNLVKFCEVLLDIPGMSKLCNKRNCRNETALQVAKRKQHTEMIYMIETKLNEERDSGIQERCLSDYDFVAPKQGMTNDIYKNREQLQDRDSEDVYLEPEDESVDNEIQLPKRCLSGYTQMAHPDTTVTKTTRDIYENREQLQDKDSEDVYLEPEDESVDKEIQLPKRCQSGYIQMDYPDTTVTKTIRGRDSGVHDVSDYASMDPFPELARNRHDSNEKKKRETYPSRESDYMPMEQEDLSENTDRDSDYMPMDQHDLPEKDALTIDSDYIPMDTHENAPPIPPKAHKAKPRYVNQLLPDDVFKNPSYSVQEDDIYEKPRDREQFERGLQHSHSESETSDMHRPHSASEDEGTSSSMSHDGKTNNLKYVKEKRSLSLPGEIRLPVHHQKNKIHNPFKKFMNVIHHGHDENHEHKNGRQKRNPTKDKNIHPIPEEHPQNDIQKRDKKGKKGKLQHRKSIRINRLMEDNNIKVLSLPEKKTDAKLRQTSQWFDKDTF